MEISGQRKLIIIGAGGHGRVIADIGRLNGYKDIVFLDDSVKGNTDEGCLILGPVEMIDKTDGDIVVAIGNSHIRQSIIDKYTERFFPTLIHPSAVIARDTDIGKGSVVMAGAVINPGARIGTGCIVNTSSSVDHDCIVADYCHISVGAHLAGTVTLGRHCWIGAGAIVSNNIEICSEVTLGAGAVAIKDIMDKGTYIGIPATKKPG